MIGKTKRSAQATDKEMSMKKYIKPSLTALGLLRDVTKFSGCRTSDADAICRVG
jgi:hypothetical protein